MNDDTLSVNDIVNVCIIARLRGCYQYVVLLHQSESCVISKERADAITRLSPAQKVDSVAAL